MSSGTDGRWFGDPQMVVSVGVCDGPGARQLCATDTDLIVSDGGVPHAHIYSDSDADRRSEIIAGPTRLGDPGDRIRYADTWANSGRVQIIGDPLRGLRGPCGRWLESDPGGEDPSYRASASSDRAL